MLVVFVMETYIFKVKSTGHLLQFFLAFIVFDILRQQYLTDGIHGFDTFCNSGQQGNDRRYLIDHGSKITLIQCDITGLDLPADGEISGKCQTDHLKDLEYRPTHRSKQCLDQIQLIALLRHSKQLPAHFGYFFILQGMGSGHGYQFHHFHDSGGGLFHFLTELRISLLHNIPEGNHGNCRHRGGQQEKYKYDAALTDSDHQCNPDIQGNI